MATTTNTVNWKRVALDGIQIAVGIGLLFAGAHGTAFGDGATATSGAILVGSGVRGLADA